MGTDCKSALSGLIWFAPLIYAAVNLGVDMIQNNGNMNIGQISMSLAQGALSGFMSGATGGGQALLGALAGQLGRFMPAMPLYQSKEFSLSVSPFIGYVSSGFSSGISFNASGQFGDFAYSASAGFGSNQGASSLGEAMGASNFWNAGGFAGYNDGSYTYGAGYSINSFDGKGAQKVGAITIQVGQFGLRIDEDWFYGTDESRTGGVLATFQANKQYTFALGMSMITGRGVQGSESKLNSTDIRGTYTDEVNPNLRGGIFYGGFIHNGQTTFYGHNSENRLHKRQNQIHNLESINTPYFPDRGLKSKAYSYSGSFHSNYLFY